MGVPQQHYNHKAAHEENHQNVLRGISDIFSASISYATQLAEIRYSQCSDDEQTALEEAYGGGYSQVITGLVREAAALIGIDLCGYRVSYVKDVSFSEPHELVSFDQLIDVLKAVSE